MTDKKPIPRSRGSIRQVAPGKFRVRVYTGKNAVTGKPEYHDETIKGKKKDADALLSRVTHKLDEGKYIRPTQKTVGQTFDDWLKIHRTKVAERTADWYLRNFDNRARPVLGSILLKKLKPEQIEDFYASLHGEL